jgi:hypothetical protein
MVLGTAEPGTRYSMQALQRRLKKVFSVQVSGVSKPLLVTPTPPSPIKGEGDLRSSYETIDL